MNKSLVLFCKGCFMGICDLIPGISGGTIAFVTGIYPRLIKSVKILSSYLFVVPVVWLTSCVVFSNSKKRRRFKSFPVGQDIKFLLVLFLGIGFSIFTFSRLIGFLLDNYLAYTISFFLGLILASSKLIFEQINTDSYTDIVFGFLGLILGGLFVILTPSSPEPTLIYVFFGGFCAVNAMFLPGISGAFVLLILGLYGFMVNVLNNILANLVPFFVFILGALLGAFTVSRIVTFFFKNKKNKTLYFLLGLVLGSAGVPARMVVESGLSLDYWNILKIVGYLALGSLVFVIFTVIAKIQKKYYLRG